MEKLVTITDINLINDLKGYENITKVYPLKSFCNGYTLEFAIEDIDEFVLINRLLNDSELNKLSCILKKAKIKGIIFDDLGILDIVAKMPITKILLLDHLASSSKTINYYLDYVDSVVISSDLTANEIAYIVKNASKKLVLNVFGLKKLMYSRRCLLTNYATYEKIKNKKNIKAKLKDKEFIIKENKFGTSFYAYPYYNALSLLKLPALYYFYDPIDLKSKEIIKVLNGKIDFPTSRLFLDQKTIYKLKE